MEKSSKKIAILVLAFNEEKTIKKLVEEIQENIVCEIIIVNDGSIDRTKIIVEDFTRNHRNVHLLNHLVNVGPHTGMQTAVKYAKYLNCNIFVQVDGDGQHPPNQIKKLLNPIIENNVDVVIGSRYLENSNYMTSFTRRFGIKATSKVISILTGKKITDVSSGFRAFNLKYAHKILEEFQSVDTLFEFTLRICRHGFIIKEIPIEMKQREHGSSYLSIPRLFVYPFRISYSVIRAFI